MTEWLNIALWIVWSGTAVLCSIHMASIIAMEVTHNRNPLMVSLYGKYVLKKSSKLTLAAFALVTPFWLSWNIFG